LVSQPLRVHRYTTENVAAKDRHEVWLSHWPSTAPLYHTEPLEEFRVSSNIALLGDISLVFTDISAQRWKRDSKLIDRGNDTLNLTVNLDGKAWGIAGAEEREWVQMPGSAVVVDRQQTSSHISAGGRSISISVPRALATEAGLDVASLHGVTLNPSEHAMFTSHALHVRDVLARFSEADAARLGRTMLDVLVLSLKAAQRSDAHGYKEDPSTLLLRAEREIRENLGSPALTVANLCRRLSVSRSTLHRVFEASGGVQAYIRDMRLDAARHALLNPGSPERIGDLAERLGFSDAAHLSRLFKTRFGETPSDCRARAVLHR